MLENEVTPWDSLVQGPIIGNGHDIVSAASELIRNTLNEELILVTCFWARSKSLTSICNLLRALSAKALSEGRIFRVRICFSSLSILQKLSHTSSLRGKVYNPSSWTQKLGLPSPETLRGLDLLVKSIFVKPFSVMHPKFFIIDRKLCLLPSCNISWEDWFEGCIALQGPIVACFVDFWTRFWHNGLQDPSPQVNRTTSAHTNDPFEEQRETLVKYISTTMMRSCPDAVYRNVKATFLLSEHHRDPRFRPCPCQHFPKHPETQLNTFTINIINEARVSVLIQTPNLSAPPVLAALNKALQRGVGIRIVTNERLMTMEQLVTSGSTTPRCISRLVSAHEKMLAKAGRDIEGGNTEPGHLHISYFIPREFDKDRRSQTHLKLTVVDKEVTILGSGNMDRASFYTSQELGVAIQSRDFAISVMKRVAAALEGHLQERYTSGVERGE